MFGRSTSKLYIQYICTCTTALHILSVYYSNLTTLHVHNGLLIVRVCLKQLLLHHSEEEVIVQLDGATTVPQVGHSGPSKFRTSLTWAVPAYYMYMYIVYLYTCIRMYMYMYIICIIYMYIYMYVFYGFFILV